MWDWWGAAHTYRRGGPSAGTVSCLTRTSLQIMAATFMWHNILINNWSCLLLKVFNISRAISLDAKKLNYEEWVKQACHWWREALIFINLSYQLQTYIFTGIHHFSQGRRWGDPITGSSRSRAQSTALSYLELYLGCNNCRWGSSDHRLNIYSPQLMGSVHVIITRSVSMK